MRVDVALVPRMTRAWVHTVCVVVDELRASSTITLLLDMQCELLMLTASVAGARRLARAHSALLVGERHGLLPAGFDFNNSSADLAQAGVRGRSVVLTTTNGTRVLAALEHMPAVVVGCLRNAGACAEAAVALAEAQGADLGIVCAGLQGQFALDDAVAAGVIVARILDAVALRGWTAEPTDAALGAAGLAARYPDPVVALRQSASGRLLARLGAGDDIELCGQVDVSRTVPVLEPGAPLRLVRQRTPSSPVVPT